MISAGEDDTVRVWKDGKEVDVWREKGRKGGVWALEVDSHRGKVIAGLIDGRVRILDLQLSDSQPHGGQKPSDDERVESMQWPLNVIAPAPVSEEVEAEVEYCRVLIRGVGDDDFFLATSTCRILHFCRPSAFTFPQPVCIDLSVTALGQPIVALSLSPDHRCLAVGDNRGHLVLLFLQYPSHLHPTLQSTVEASTADCGVVGLSFIYFLSLPRHCSSPTSLDLLTSDAVGGVRWWRVEEGGAKSVRLQTQFRLPVRAPLTCALLLTRDDALLLLCGDSKGSVYVYQIVMSDDSVFVFAVSRLSGVHYSVSCLLDLDDGRLLSVGKDGCLHYYDLHRSDDPQPPPMRPG